MSSSKKARIPAATRAMVMAASTHCVACGTWDADECGHIVSEFCGGTVELSNLVRLCGSCNRVMFTASVSFAAFATYTESPALIRSRRAYWSRYIGACQVKGVKPYKPL